MKLVSISCFFGNYNTKCQLLLLCLTYAFIGRAKKKPLFQGLLGGLWQIRTVDLFRVKEAL